MDMVRFDFKLKKIYTLFVYKTTNILCLGVLGVLKFGGVIKIAEILHMISALKIWSYHL